MTEPRQSCHRAGALLLALAAPAWACGAVVDSVNAVRHLGCESRPAAPPVHPNARLDAAAQRLSQGADLRSALKSAGYHEVSSFSVSISNVPPSGDVERTLAAITTAAKGSENLVPKILDAVRVYASVGEISDAMRTVFGAYEEVAIT